MELGGQARSIMFTIENLKRHCLNSGAIVACSAILRNNDRILHVELSQSGDNIVAYESETDLIHHLNVPKGVAKVDDLRDGDEISIKHSVVETAPIYQPK